MPAKLKYSKEFLSPLFERFKKGEQIKDLHSEIGISRSSLCKYFRKLFFDDPIYRKLSDQFLIDCYVNRGMTGEEIRSKYNIYRDKLYLIFNKKCINFKMKMTYDQVKNGMDVVSINKDKIKLAREYFENNNVENYQELCDKFDIKSHFIYKALKGCTPFKKSKKFYDLIISDYIELKNTELVAKKHNISQTNVRKILSSNNIDYRSKHPKEQKPKRVRKKKETSDTEPKIKLKVIRRVKKDSKRVKLPHELPKMQQGEVKVKKNEKVLKTLPEEVRNKGYKLRIDDKTEIYVKDGVSPEVARERFLKRYSNNYKF